MGLLQQNDTWIVTDISGNIERLSSNAAALMNLTVRGARGRSLILFFEEDRQELLRYLYRAYSGAVIVHHGTFRPLGRRPVPVQTEIAVVHEDEQVRGSLMRWVFQSAS